MSAHFAFIGIPAWGHARPMLTTALNLVSLFPQLSITFLIHPSFSSMVKDEISVFSPSGDQTDRLRVVFIGDASSDSFADPDSTIRDITAYLEKVLPEGSTGFDQRPSLFVVDMFVTSFIDVLQKSTSKLSIDPKSIPTLVFVPSPSSATLDYFSPLEHGGRIAATRERIKQLSEKSKLPGAPPKTQDEILREAYHHSEGKIIKVAGAPPIYDYELNPQSEAVPFPPPIVGTLVLTQEQMQKSAGFVLPTSPDLEPGASLTLEEVTGGLCLEIGPQFPASWWGSVEARKGPSVGEKGTDVIKFLSSCEEKFGKQSVLYISFGSSWFPSLRPDLVYTLLDALATAEPPLPFVFATAGASPELHQELVKYVAQNGSRGLVCKFAPQMDVLTHAATGYFLTHGGSNSTSEALLNGIPMIFWPCGADQPLIAAHMTIDLGLSFELVQVRTGVGIGRPTKRGITPVGTKEAILEEMQDVWSRMRGNEGQEMRRRVNATSALLKSSWESGEARNAMLAFERFIK